MAFRDSGKRDAAIDQTGCAFVAVTSIDAVLGKTNVTFIKLKIEGGELEALRGAKEKILQYRPKLAISAYHRPSHLWQVPFLIRELNPKYNLLLRQHDGGIVETVAYGN